jgi:2-polyprenyl-3-methyl-5-hydroxy-6-metoxy-1,4-benzoquinol methylase
MLLNAESQDLTANLMDHKKATANACVNCSHSSFSQLFKGYDFDSGKKHFDLEKCDTCQLTRTSPLLSEAELGPYYDIDYYGTADKKFNPLIESWTIWSNNRLANKILRSTGSQISQTGGPTRVMDIGCGRANLLKAFNNLGCECFGIERSDFPEDKDLENITIYKQDFLNVDIEENGFDIVIIWHVLEHLADPVSTIKKAQKILKSGGSLVVAVPNFGSLQSKLFGKHWFHLDLPRHIYHFTRQSLLAILEKSGFHTKAFETRSFDQGIYGFIQSAINLLSVARPNTLYSILKSTQQNPGAAAISLQLLLAGLLAPFAFLEYLISGLTGTGACLVVRAKKIQTSEPSQ